MDAIQVENLQRTFHGRRAVDGISFTVSEGEVFGLLGPNGAGKTTTIRMLTGQLLPTGGCARVGGCDVATEADRIKPLIGVVFEYQNLYERMTARENLWFSAQLYGVQGHRVEELLAQVGLRERANERVQGYSNGMKQRLLIARALLHGPRILFLDEPTRGLDPAAAREIRHVIAQLAGQGATVLLTTHSMEEADQLCQHVAFISEGRLVALDTPDRLKVAYGQRAATVGLEDGRHFSLDLAQPEDAHRLGELAAAGQILTLHSGEATLEEVYLQLTGRRLVE